MRKIHLGCGLVPACGLRVTMRRAREGRWVLRVKDATCGACNPKRLALLRTVQPKPVKKTVAKVVPTPEPEASLLARIYRYFRPVKRAGMLLALLALTGCSSHLPNENAAANDLRHGKVARARADYIAPEPARNDPSEPRWMYPQSVPYRGGTGRTGTARDAAERISEQYGRAEK